MWRFNFYVFVIVGPVMGQPPIPFGPDAVAPEEEGNHVDLGAEATAGVTQPYLGSRGEVATSGSFASSAPPHLHDRPAESDACDQRSSRHLPGGEPCQHDHCDSHNVQPNT